MDRILVPVDGSPNSLHAVRHVIDVHRRTGAIEVYLLNVQAPFPRHITQFLARKDIRSFHRDRGENMLRPIMDMLDRAGVPHISAVKVGRRAEVIAEVAKSAHCDHIVMSTARKNSLTRMVEASVTNKVLELTTVPVKVIAGDSVSALERYGIPAAIGGGLGLLALAID